MRVNGEKRWNLDGLKNGLKDGFTYLKPDRLISSKRWKSGEGTPWHIGGNGDCPKLGDKPSWVKLGAEFLELSEAMLCREIFHIFGQNPGTLVTKISRAWILIRQKEAVYMVSLQRRDWATKMGVTLLQNLPRTPKLNAHLYIYILILCNFI